MSLFGKVKDEVSKDEDSATQTSPPRSTDQSNKSSTDSDEEDGKTPSEASDISDYPAGVTKPYCTSAWRQLQHLRGREFGYHQPTYFQHGAMGSSCFVRRFQRFRTLDKHDGCVNTLHFNEDGSLLATGSDDLNIILWDWERARPSVLYKSGHQTNVFQAKFMTNASSSVVVSAARDGQIRCGVITSSGECQGTRRVAQHRQAAHKLALEPGNPHSFLSCGEDGHVIQVDLRETKGQKILTVMNEAVDAAARQRIRGSRPLGLYSIHVNPTRPSEFALSGRDPYARIYDRRFINAEERSGAPVRHYCPDHLLESKENVTCVVYNYNGTELLATYNDEHVYLFDTSHGSGADAIRSFKGHRNSDTVKGVNFYGPHSEFVVSGSDCGHVFLWDKLSSQVVQVLEGDDIGAINCLEPHPRCAVLATSGLEHNVKVWVPAAKEATTVESLREVMSANAQSRAVDRTDTNLSRSVFQWLMHDQLRAVQARIRRQRVAEGLEVDSDSEMDTDDDDADDDDDGEGRAIQVQCPAS